MKIAIIGYGRMGHAIERIARERGHEIVATIDVDNAADINTLAEKGAEVAIEFSTPATFAANSRAVIGQGVALVSGTTGAADRLPAIKALVEATPGATMMWSSNYSLGVNIFFELNRRLAAIMAGCPQYKPEVNEIHHIHKLDHPSGTAVTMAEDIIANNPGVTAWQEPDGPIAADAVAVSHRRVGETVGTHTVTWTSPVDSLAINHTAFTRDAFALGAVIAAEWLAGKPGFHSINDLMQSLLNK